MEAMEVSSLQMLASAMEATVELELEQQELELELELEQQQALHQLGFATLELELEQQELDEPAECATLVAATSAAASSMLFCHPGLL